MLDRLDRIDRQELGRIGHTKARPHTNYIRSSSMPSHPLCLALWNLTQKQNSRIGPISTVHVAALTMSSSSSGHASLRMEGAHSQCFCQDTLLCLALEGGQEVKYR